MLSGAGTWVGMPAALLAMLFFPLHSQGCEFFWVLAKWKCGSLASVVGIKETQGYSTGTSRLLEKGTIEVEE